MPIIASSISSLSFHVPSHDKSYPACLDAHAFERDNLVVERGVNRDNVADSGISRDEAIALAIEITKFPTVSHHLLLDKPSERAILGRTHS